MLDAKLVRENPDLVRKAMADRRVLVGRERVPAPRRGAQGVIGEVEALQARRNDMLPRPIGGLMKDGRREDARGPQGRRFAASTRSSRSARRAST